MTKYKKMLGFIKKCFFTGLTFLLTLTSVNLLSCNSMNNQECKVSPQIVNVNGKGVCDKGFIWNPSNCECECYKACDFSECLDYKNCKCKGG